MVFMSTSITVYPGELSKIKKELAEHSLKVGELAGVLLQYTGRNVRQGERRVSVDLL